MSTVYVVNSDGKTVPMNPVRCKNEEKELQQLLESNPQLMPGDQMRPHDPLRWLLIKREMPVPDPSSGEDRWSIDHFFVDQSATPTFVECKRFLDTRSRREVLGQMLDYAANGHWYWDRESIRNYAADTCKERGIELEQALKILAPDVDGVDEFLEQVENNLREGQIRMVFFMEEAPQELKSIVDFLNKQMERSEILIVEAKQFESGGIKVVAPSLFGFTEEARRVKRTVTVTAGSNPVRKKWNEAQFLQKIEEDLDAPSVTFIKDLLQFSHSSGYQLRWGSGAKSGSFGLLVDTIAPRTLFVVTTDGYLSFNYGWINGSEKAEAFRDEYADAMRNKVGFPVSDETENKFPNIKISEHISKGFLFLETFRGLLTKYGE